MDISQAVLTSRWFRFCRAMRNDFSLGDLILNNYGLCERRKFQKIRTRGSNPTIHQSMLRFLCETSSSIRIKDKIFDLLSCNLLELWHYLRDLGRKMVWRQVRTDVLRSKRAPFEPLPHLHDVGCEGGVDRIETMKCCKSSSHNPHKGVLRTILCNGVWTRSSRSKLPEKTWPVSNLSALRTGEN